MSLKLPRLPVNWQDNPTLVSRYWDQAMTQIEDNVNQILQIPAIQAAIASTAAAAAAANTAAIAANTAATAASTAASTAATAASTANTAATTAQATANATALDNSLGNSYIDTTSFAGSLLLVTSTGVVTIQTHVRIYGDPTLNPNVTVNGGTLTVPGVITGDVIRIYYSDPSRAGGTVTYQATVDPAAPPVQAGDVHSVGAVTVPATGSSIGNIIAPRGFVYPGL